MRSRRIARLTSYVLAAMVAVAHTSVAAAQSDDSDLKEINAYRLSEAKLAKFVQASRNLVAAVQSNPEIKGNDLEKENPSLSEMAAFYDSKPPVKRAINSAGMTSREYVTFMLSMFQAGMMSWAAKQPGAKLPADFPKDNVAFYDAHQKEIEAATAEFKKLEAEEEESADEGEPADDPPAR